MFKLKYFPLKCRVRTLRAKIAHRVEEQRRNIAILQGLEMSGDIVSSCRKEKKKKGEQVWPLQEVHHVIIGAWD